MPEIAAIGVDLRGFRLLRARWEVGPSCGRRGPSRLGSSKFGVFVPGHHAPGPSTSTPSSPTRRRSTSATPPTRSCRPASSPRAPARSLRSMCCARTVASTRPSGPRTPRARHGRASMQRRRRASTSSCRRRLGRPSTPRRRPHLRHGLRGRGRLEEAREAANERLRAPAARASVGAKGAVLADASVDEHPAVRVAERGVLGAVRERTREPVSLAAG